MHFEPIDYVGAIGGFMILFAFFRMSIGGWKSTSIWYELDNLIGATLMSVYAFSKSAYVSILLNLVWALVAFRGVSSYAERRMAKMIKEKHKKTNALKK